MSWRDFIGNLVEKCDSPTPALPFRPITDPFNYALALSLRLGATSDALQRLAERFPAISQPEAASLLKDCEALIHQAVLMYYKVRDGKLSEDEAEAQIKQAAPTIDQPNLRLLRGRSHLVASK